MFNDCSLLLNNIDRLEALGQTGLFGSEPEEAFTRLNNLATKMLKAPISIFSLISNKSQFFKSAKGFEITVDNNEVPIDMSVCQYSLQGKPLVIEDTKSHPLFSQNPAVLSLNIAGYLGIPVVTKDGHAIGAVCVIDHERRVWTEDEISILEDITASFISEIELRQAMAKSENEVKLREEFIAIASHELKNPLTAFKLQANLLQRKLSKGILTPQDNEQFLSNLERQTRRLELMIDDMGDATRLSTGKFTLKKEEASLRKIILEVAENLAETLVKAQCSLTLEAGNEGIGFWDSSRIEQVITNLITNATKYAPKAPIDLRLIKEGSHFVMTITDHGPGISAIDQLNIFDKYGRAADVRMIQGLGLGLYISQQIIEAHEGTLDVSSELGQGATFRISLPAL